MWQAKQDKYSPVSLRRPLLGRRELVQKRGSITEDEGSQDTHRCSLHARKGWIPPREVPIKNLPAGVTVSGYDLQSCEIESLINRNDDRRHMAIDGLHFVEVFDNTKLKKLFEAMKRRLTDRGCRFEEVWVYHGTSGSNIIPIMTEGFKVGGVDGIQCVNGVSYGYGVYTSSTPNLAKTYCKEDGVGKLILSKALMGRTMRWREWRATAVKKALQATKDDDDDDDDDDDNGGDGDIETGGGKGCGDSDDDDDDVKDDEGEGGEEDEADSWRGEPPFEDVIVFKSGRQLLPLYVLHFVP